MSSDRMNKDQPNGESSKSCKSSTQQSSSSICALPPRILTMLSILVKKPGVHTASYINAAGFIYTGDGDTARCDDCGLEVSQWTLDMNPFTIHSERSPQCPFIRSLIPSQKAPAPFSSSLAAGLRSESISNQRTNHSQSQATNVANLSNTLLETDMLQQVRKRTFSHWPHRTIPSSAQMIEAGFFNCNIEDRVICTYCNLICQQWTPHTDDPCEVHKMLSPNCVYVKAKLIRPTVSSMVIVNENSIDTVIKNHSLTTNINSQQLLIPDESTLLRLVADRLDLSISQSLLDQGFELHVVEQCWRDQLRLKQDDFVSDCDLSIACTLLQKQIEHIDGKKENIVIPSVKIKEIRDEAMKAQIELLRRERAAAYVDFCNSTLSRSTTVSASTDVEMTASLQSLTNQSSIDSTTTDDHGKTNITDPKTFSINDHDQSTNAAASNPCVLCLTEEKGFACIPCGHLATCVPCGHSLRSCPKCRREMEAFVRIHI